MKVKAMHVELTPSYVDLRVLKSLTAAQREDLIKRGLDVDKLEKSLMLNLMKSRMPTPGTPAGGAMRDRSNLVPRQELVTRNGRQQQMTVWVNPGKEGDKEDDQSGQKQTNNEEQQNGSGSTREYIASDGTKVSLKPSGNSNFPFTVTVTDKTGHSEIKQIINEKLAEQEVRNLVGNLDEATERAQNKEAEKHPSRK